MTLMRCLLIPLLMAIAVGLCLTILSLPEGEPGLQEAVAQQLTDSGVRNPVTAVLLNFRAYDTLLELVVLLLAVLGVWSFGAHAGASAPGAGEVLDALARLITPILILVSVYLLWAGAHAPGGAFQAGAVLSAAAVLLILCGWQPPAVLGRAPLRLGLTLGITGFLLVGMSTLFSGRSLLQYPPDHAGSLIMLIETAATGAIALTLTLLFIGTAPAGRNPS